MAIYCPVEYTLRRVLPWWGIGFITARLMSANHQSQEKNTDTAHRDRLLRRLIGCFAAAAFMAFGLAVSMSLWQQNGGDLEPVSLVQDGLR